MPDLTPSQIATLAAITDPVKREMMRRLFEKACAAYEQPPAISKPISLVIDADAERLRSKWRS